MIGYAELRALDARAWLTAGREWQQYAEQAEARAREIPKQVVGPMTIGWSDRAGQAAAKKGRRLTKQLFVAAVECRAVSFVCQGLGHVLVMSQNLLTSAETLAARYRLTITGDGSVKLPSPLPGAQFMAELVKAQGQVRLLIQQALTTATQADQRATAELDRLAGRTGVTDPHVALNEDMGGASRVEVDMLNGTIPTGGSPGSNERWWSALSDEDRKLLMTSSAGTLENLNGLPADVREQLRGSDKLDRAAVARWAGEHWNDLSNDPFANNCTNFASNSLADGGGLSQKPDGWTGVRGDSWSRNLQTGWDWLDRSDGSHSSSWAGAQNFYDFMTRHGAQEVAVPDARPGDIVMWQDVNPDGSPGKVHHAAVVTSVIDGDIRYTQHTSEQLNASLAGRTGYIENGVPYPDDPEERGWGRQNVRILRPQPDW